MFIEENKNSFKSELIDIFIRLKVIGNKTGAREQFFKQYEGNLGDGVCALYDEPEKHLRILHPLWNYNNHLGRRRAKTQ